MSEPYTRPGHNFRDPHDCDGHGCTIPDTNDHTLVVIEVPAQQIQVLTEFGKVLILCTHCIIPSDKAGYVKNTKNCGHLFIKETKVLNTNTR